MALPRPFAYWPFGELTGTYAGDASGQGHHLFLQPGHSWNFTLQKFGPAAMENVGPNRVAEIFGYPSGTVHSVAFWLNGVSGTDGVVIGGASGYAAAYVNWDGGTGGSLYYFVPGAGGTVSFPHGGLAGMNHFVLTRNNLTVRAWKNGVELPTGDTFTLNTPMQFNSLLGYENNTSPLHATIDEVRLYDLVLTPAQVVELYQLVPPYLLVPVGHWPFNEGAGLNALDISGLNRTVILDNVDNWDLSTNRKFGFAALRNFPMTGRAAHFVDPWFIGVVHSIAFWLSDYVGGDGVVLGGANNVFLPYLNTPLPNGTMYYSSGTGGTAVLHHGLGGSNHICITRSFGRIRLYKNAQLLGENMLGNPLEETIFQSLLAYDSGLKPIHATIDDFRVYPVELNQEQVTALFGFNPDLDTLQSFFLIP